MQKHLNNQCVSVCVAEGGGAEVESYGWDCVCEKIEISALI